MTRLAVVLFNLGGPDRPESVQPFLFNLFRDPAILPLPQPFRWLLAKLIAARRAPVATEIYRKLGGGSPLLALTEAQARALEGELAELQATETKVFVAMRYWHPMSAEAAAQVEAFEPDEIVLLPLYPQFSTTTTGSSLRAWRKAAEEIGLDVPTRIVCCYPVAAGFIRAQAELIRASLAEAARAGRPRLLFSAHGLPKKVVARGDPYQEQVEQTAAAVAAALDDPGLDWRVCYQSRVGPLEWIGPATEEEIARAGAEGRPLVVVPIAFVSEHSETLVELDIDYRHRAESGGTPAYVRVPALGTHPLFVRALADMVRAARTGPAGACGTQGQWSCPSRFGRCVREQALAMLRS